ncbi:MAG TPA: energy transducer TonB [Caulobacteraceae bacterium]
MTGRLATKGFWLAGLAGLLLAGAGHATPANSGSAPLVDKDPLASLQAPGAATGHVVLRCQVTADRSVDHCLVANETPPGHGLGEAALRMVQQFRIKPETFRPEMVGQMVNIPLSFEPDADADDMPDGVAATPAPAH